MNCELSRLHIALGREGRSGEAGELLNAHLQHCPQCASIVARETAFDNALAAAMTDVPLPTGLHDRLLKSAYSRRGANLRRSVGRAFALAAAVFAAIGVGAGAYWRTRPNLNTDAFVFESEFERESPKEAVQNWLAEQHLPPSLPLDFEYRWHVFHGEGKIGPAKVPVVVFQRGSEFARVYIVKESAAKLESLKDAQSSLCKVTVIRVPGRPDLVYVILHSTDTLDPFLRQNLTNIPV